ncbi:hypothetical protein [Flavobacterium sp.]
MKTKHFFTSLFVLLFSATLLTGCSSDSSSSGGDTSQLMDKWFYDTEDFTADVRFNANGSYQQFIEISGMTFSNTGTWEWVNESQKIMHISYETGPNAVAEAWFKFSNITDHGFSVKQSTDGVSYTTEARSYLDTDE